MSDSARPTVVFGTPRKLPKAASLRGRVVVLDLAFASEGTGSGGFEKITGKFLRDLGDRLAAWIDHHDHQRHAEFKNDPRFVLKTKQEHGACPEMVTPALVTRVGAVDTILCHDDLDGLYSAAKWLLKGNEPYAGADDDARAVDTRIGTPSSEGALLDRALRGRPTDTALRQTVLRYLTEKPKNPDDRELIENAAMEFASQEATARELAKNYRVERNVAFVEASGFVALHGTYDKTLVLLLGQERARIAVLADETTVSIAAPFDSGINLLETLGITGGMPTRVSVPRSRLSSVLEQLRSL